MIDHGYGVQLSVEIPWDKAREWRNLHQIRDFTRENDLITNWHHDQYVRHVEKRKDIRLYGIVATEDDVNFTSYETGYRRVVGICGLTSIDHIHSKAEWSLYIAPDRQQKGYGSSALMTLLYHGFNSLNLNRIWGEIFATNKRTIALAEKVGFALEGTLRGSYWKDGAYTDSYIYGMLRGEFNAKKVLR